MRLSDIFKEGTSEGAEKAWETRRAGGRGQWVPGYEGRVKDYRRPGNDNDGKEQAKWLERQARIHGYDTLDMMAEMDAHLFNRLAAKWREDQRELALRDEKRTLQVFKFDPNQPRDEKGRWASVGAALDKGMASADAALGRGVDKVISAWDNSKTAMTVQRGVQRGVERIFSGLDRLFKYDPDQPRDDRGRWIPVNLGKGEFGLERVTEVNENGREKVVSLGLAPNTFHSMGQAERAAAARNKQKNLNAITDLAVEMRRRKERGIPFSPDDQQSYYESRTAKEEPLFGEIFKGGAS